MKKIVWSILLISSMGHSHGETVNTSDCENDCCTIECGDCDNRCCDDMFFCKSHFSPRSQGSDTARRLVASHLYEHQFEMDKWYGTFAVTFEFQRNFRQNELAQYFLPKCDPCDPCITFGEDDQTGIDARSADFGLSCTGQVCLCPQYSSFVADLQWWVGLNEWCPGTYFELFIPIAHTWVDFNCCSELLLQSKEANACAEAFPCDPTDPSVCGLMTTDFTDAEKNEVGTTDLVAALRGNFTWGDVENKLCYGKMCCDNIDKTGVADLQFNIGYDFWQCETAHIGLKLILKAPTGNVAEGVFALEPIVGNGGHFELGAGLNASAVLWDKDIDQQVSWWLEVDATHLFNSRLQRRVFDLKNNGCWSRYLLLKTFKNNGTEIDGLERGPNVFNACLKVHAGAQVDLTSLWSYRNACWNFDIAYNFWSRSEEKADCDKICCNIDPKTYGIKGTIDMRNRLDDEIGIVTASKSTIAKSQGLLNGVDGLDPVFVTCDDLDYSSGLAPSAYSNSVVAHVSYLWPDTDYEPYFGIGGKAEFSGNGNSALNQWAIWAKGGFSF